MGEAVWAGLSWFVRFALFIKGKYIKRGRERFFFILFRWYMSKIHKILPYIFQTGKKLSKWSDDHVILMPEKSKENVNKISCFSSCSCLDEPMTSKHEIDFRLVRHSFVSYCRLKCTQWNQIGKWKSEFITTAFIQKKTKTWHVILLVRIVVVNIFFCLNTKL